MRWDRSTRWSWLLICVILSCTFSGARSKRKIKRPAKIPASLSPPNDPAVHLVSAPPSSSSSPSASSSTSSTFFSTKLDCNKTTGDPLPIWCALPSDAMERFTIAERERAATEVNAIWYQQLARENVTIDQTAPLSTNTSSLAPEEEEEETEAAVMPIIPVEDAARYNDGDEWLKHVGEPLQRRLHARYANHHRKLRPSTPMLSFEGLEEWHDRFMPVLNAVIAQILRVFQRGNPKAEAVPLFLRRAFKVAFVLISAYEMLLRFAESRADVMARQLVLRRDIDRIWSGLVLQPISDYIDFRISTVEPTQEILDILKRHMEKHLKISLPRLGWSKTEAANVIAYFPPGRENATELQVQAIEVIALQYEYIKNIAVFEEECYWTIVFVHHWHNMLPLTSVLMKMDVWMVDYTRALHLFEDTMAFSHRALKVWSKKTGCSPRVQFTEGLAEHITFFQDPLVQRVQKSLNVDVEFYDMLSRATFAEAEQPPYRDVLDQWPRMLMMSWHYLDMVHIIQCATRQKEDELGLPAFGIRDVMKIRIDTLNFNNPTAALRTASTFIQPALSARFEWALHFGDDAKLPARMSDRCLYWRQWYRAEAENMAGPKDNAFFRMAIDHAVTGFEEAMYYPYEASLLRTYLGDTANTMKDDKALFPYTIAMELLADTDREAAAQAEEAAKRDTQKARKKDKKARAKAAKDAAATSKIEEDTIVTEIDRETDSQIVDLPDVAVEDDLEQAIEPLTIQTDFVQDNALNGEQTVAEPDNTTLVSAIDSKLSFDDDDTLEDSDVGLVEKVETEAEAAEEAVEEAEAEEKVTTDEGTERYATNRATFEQCALQSDMRRKLKRLAALDERLNELDAFRENEIGQISPQMRWLGRRRWSSRVSRDEKRPKAGPALITA